MAEKKPETDENGSTGHWEILSETERFRCPIFSVVSRHCRHPIRRHEHDFFVLKSPDWVMALALTKDGKLVMVRQYRFGTNALSLEIPGGIMEAGEDPVTAAQRELREETGYSGKRARLIGQSSPNPAIQDNAIHFVLVEDVERTDGQTWDMHEEMDVELMPVDEVLARGRAGEIVHALALNALFAFEPYWDDFRHQRHLT